MTEIPEQQRPDAAEAVGEIWAPAPDDVRGC
jgi:hypothetical protein